MLLQSLDAHIAQITHAEAALRAAIDNILVDLESDSAEVIVSRRGERSVIGTLKLSHEFYRVGRYIFTPQKVHSVFIVNGFVNIVIL